MKFKDLKLEIEAVEEKPIKINGKTVLVKQFLPLEKKMELIQRIIESSVDVQEVFNPLRLSVFADLFLVLYYSDIIFEDKDLEDDNLPKLFDILETNKVLTKIIKEIPRVEYNWIMTTCKDYVQEILNFNNSLLGFITSLKDSTEDSLKTIEKAKALLDPDGQSAEMIGIFQEILDKNTPQSNG